MSLRWSHADQGVGELGAELERKVQETKQLTVETKQHATELKHKDRELEMHAHRFGATLGEGEIIATRECGDSPLEPLPLGVIDNLVEG